MKHFLTLTLLPMLATSSLRAVQAESFLIFEDGRFDRAWIVASSASAIRYKETEQAVGTKDLKRSAVQSIYILDPPEFTEAMELFQGRKYAEAKDKFAAVAKEYKPINELPDNPATAAGFYEMECLRKLGDLDGLAQAMDSFQKQSLTRENQFRQIELNAMWEAVRKKDWSRLRNICTERLKERIPGSQRAQVGYCLALALDAEGEIYPAINAYNIAMTADTGASEDLTRKAALNSMALYKKDPEVQSAIKLWGTKDENPNSAGQQRLFEAAALAELYELSLGGGTPLPAEHKDLLKYVAKVKVD